MKSLRNYVLGLVVLLLVVALLVWFLPAKWAMPWIEPQLHGLQLKQVQGTLWQGRSDRVTSAAGENMGKLQWTLSRRALLGDAQVRMDFDGPSLSFSGAARRLPEQKIEVDGLTLHARLEGLELHGNSPLGKPGGQLSANVGHALLQGGWPLEMQLHALWKPAVMHAPEGDVALGALVLQAQAQGGVIQVHLRDDGTGPLAANGQMQFSPLGWRLDATLSSRQTDPSLERWLATLGTPSPDGSVHVQRQGGLAATLPAPTEDQGLEQP